MTDIKQKKENVKMHLKDFKYRLTILKFIDKLN